jgi:hypothetical protein
VNRQRQFAFHIESAWKFVPGEFIFCADTFDRQFLSPKKGSPARSQNRKLTRTALTTLGHVPIIGTWPKCHLQENPLPAGAPQAGALVGARAFFEGDDLKQLDKLSNAKKTRQSKLR